MGICFSGVAVFATLTAALIGCSSQSAPLTAPHAAASSTKPLALSAAPGELKVMTFNLRVATFIDLTNSWNFRRGMVVERIRSFDPDILGTQEGLLAQTSFLRKQLPDYTFFGVGRNDGKDRGEMCGLFFKSSRFTQIAGGHFWLSSNPEKAGSKAWGAWFPRIVTWIKLQPQGGGEPFFCFNTHFDAFASRAREQSAKLLLSRMNSIAGASPCIVTGDFNAGPDSKPYQILSSSLTDAFRAANPTPGRQEGTRHDFLGGRGGNRIDWVFTTSGFTAISATIDHARGLLGYPSDHFPVGVTLRPLTIARKPFAPAAPSVAAPVASTPVVSTPVARVE